MYLFQFGDDVFVFFRVCKQVLEEVFQLVEEPSYQFDRLEKDSAISYHCSRFMKNNDNNNYILLKNELTLTQFNIGYLKPVWNTRRVVDL